MNINMKRVKKDIEIISAFNATPGNGVTRLAFSKEIKLARDYIEDQMIKINLKTWEDGYSTLFGRKEGKDPDAPIIMMGSHYDSVINGGMFDGVAGVVAALEIARVLEENNIEHNNPIEIAAMNDEEGVRFGTAIGNSRAMAGLIDGKELYALVDSDNISLPEAMENLGITLDLEDAKRPPNSIESFIELHIEQGPILEENKVDIGLVESIIGLNRYTVNFIGKSGHAGTTPMDKRKDALVAAAYFILAINQIATDLTPGTVGTVGKLDLTPNAPNVIPSNVQLSVDIRSDDNKELRKIKSKLIREIEIIEKKTNVDIILVEGTFIPPVKMESSIIKKMENITDRLGYTYMRMNSGAGHDAMMMASICKSNMIFVPSRDGLSHHPDEWTEYEDLEKGIELMLNLVIELSN